ncbi:MAG: hypothetical protein FJ202_11905, partial [Gemmatimonadetes bacterium]|nr:hypothetical protein [Gemmatimonadota bacterium]
MNHRCEHTVIPTSFGALGLVASLVVLGASSGHAQIIRGNSPAPAAVPTAGPDTLAPPIERARRAQADFERLRRMTLPDYRGPRSGNCDERVGMWCYWYDEKSTMPTEPPEVASRRRGLIARLDSLASLSPEDQWILAQRIRYLTEDKRPAEAVAAARACPGGTWWCDVMLGFALHMSGEYFSADSVYELGVAKMLPRDQCAWRDISQLLDPDALQTYRRTPCGDAKRREFEDRAWFYARTLYLMHGNDSRTEYFARMTMVLMLRDSGTPHQNGFSDDERELMMRFGWPTAWAKQSQPTRGGGPAFSIVSHEPVPAYRYIPAGFVLNNPAVSDSADWRLQLPPVIGRYAPPYAKTFRALEHQRAMFRRGDTAVVMVAYDAKDVAELAGESVEAGLTVSPGDRPRSFQARKSGGAAAGILTVKAPWGPLIMSAEVAAPAKSVVARARYGISPPYAVGTRVSLSDLLFFKPFGSFPTTAEEAIPHALPTERVMANQKL